MEKATAIIHSVELLPKTTPNIFFIKIVVGFVVCVELAEEEEGGGVFLCFWWCFFFHTPGRRSLVSP